MPTPQRPHLRPQRFVVGDTTPDLLDPAINLELGQDGCRASRTHLVANLHGDGFARLMAAIQSPEIPRLGSFDPTLYVPVSSLRASLVPECSDAAYVTINYGEHRQAPDFDNDPNDQEATPQIEIVSNLQSVKTAFDVSRDLLVIDNYIGEGEPGTSGELEPPQGGEVEYMLVMHTVIAHRREKESPGLWKSPFYSGTLNETTIFATDYGPGDPMDMWLANIDGHSDDGGDTWNVTYTFQRNPDTWNTVIVWRDPETGLPGGNVVGPRNMIPTGEAGADQNVNGAKVVRIYPRKEFRHLRLPTNFFGPSP